MNFSEYLKYRNRQIGLSEMQESSQINNIDDLKEDMLGPADSSGTIVVNPEVPGQIMQTPASLATGMDTFSLAGPGKKKKSKSKKKKTVEHNKVGSFSDFMSSK
jgi:hypothetical protein